MRAILDTFTSKYAVFVLGYLYGIFAADWIISKVVKRIWNILKLKAVEANKGEFEIYSWQTRILGIIERFLYIGSLQIGKAEFIAIWLTLKTVAKSRRWTEAKGMPGRAIFTTFLIGNGLSILFALAGYAGMQWALGIEWEKDYAFSVGIPIALFLVVMIQHWRLGRVQKKAQEECTKKTEN